MKATKSLIAVLLCLAPWAQGVAADDLEQKVVYHINYDDRDKQASTLNSIQNHMDAVGAGSLDLKVVVHGSGVSLLLNPDSLQRLPKFRHANADEQMAARIDSLRLQGARFHVCGNTLRSRNVDWEKDLYDVDPVDIVASGIATLAELQGQGYVYIKP